ncbi:MAG: hypothetical protein IKP67_06435, partial [Spirochaetales bacterium]|nr:hypothetical protein [Spirochaetales bacterium]
ELCKTENISWYYNADEDTDMIQQSYLTQKKNFIMEHGEYKQIKNNIVYQCPLYTIINYRHIRYGNVCAELCQQCFLGYKPKDSNGIYCINDYLKTLNFTNPNLKIPIWFLQANINENRFMTQEETEFQKKSFKQKLKEYSL